MRLSFAFMLLLSSIIGLVVSDQTDGQVDQNIVQPESRFLKLITNAIQQRKEAMDRLMDSFYNATMRMIQTQRNATDSIRDSIRSRIVSEVRRADSITRLDGVVEEAVNVTRQAVDEATQCVKSVIDQVIEIPFQFANRVIQTLDQTIMREFGGGSGGGDRVQQHNSSNQTTNRVN
jgi:vacuolar-type H+-ATPase subunit H